MIGIIGVLFINGNDIFLLSLFKNVSLFEEIGILLFGHTILLE